MALLEAYGSDVETSCIATASGMAAIQTAVDPFLLPDVKNSLRPVYFVASTRLYGGTFQ